MAATASNPDRRRYALVLLTTLLAGKAFADVTCHVDYGGETRRIVAAPTATPLAVPVEPVGSYFLFRLVVERQTAVKVYVYADREPAQGGPLPLHQASFTWPLVHGSAHGFTGLHHVYEPVRDGELSFWCERT